MYFIQHNVLVLIMSCQCNMKGVLSIKSLTLHEVRHFHRIPLHTVKRLTFNNAIGAGRWTFVRTPVTSTLRSCLTVETPTDVRSRSANVA